MKRTYEIRLIVETDREPDATDALLIIFGPEPKNIKAYIPGDSSGRLRLTEARFNVDTVHDHDGVLEIDRYSRVTNAAVNPPAGEVSIRRREGEETNTCDVDRRGGKPA
jgi:hypothetical protein